MKLYNLAFLAVPTVLADSEEGLPGNATRTLATAKGMLAFLTGDHYTDTRDFIKEYGCYCYPQAHKTVGPLYGYSGPALDPLDEACRQYFLASKCLAIDGAEGRLGKDFDCSADNRFQWYTINDQIICGSESKPGYHATRPCRNANCELEIEFVKVVADLYNSGYEKTRAWSRPGTDEYQTMCPPVPNANPGANVLSCCGTGYARRTYNTLIKQCCQDGTTASIGSC